MSKLTEPEFYPMPLFVRLSVPDVAASAKWYQDVLGFRSVYALPGTGRRQEMNHLRLGRYQDVMLISDSSRRHPQKDERGRGMIIYLTLNKGINLLARQALAAGARVKGPTTTPWNSREFSVYDRDGYHLTFSEVVDRKKNFSDVMPETASKSSK